MDVLKLERQASAVIAWITILTGVTQILFAARLLPILGVEPSAASEQLFATVGMFMLLFGAAVLHALRRREAANVVLLWSGWQKIGAALLVCWAVAHSIFTPMAMLIAVFDLASGLLFFDLRWRMRK